MHLNFTPILLHYLHSESFSFAMLTVCSAICCSGIGSVAAYFVLGYSILDFAKYLALSVLGGVSAFGMGFLIQFFLRKLSYWIYGMMYVIVVTLTFTMAVTGPSEHEYYNFAILLLSLGFNFVGLLLGWLIPLPEYATEETDI